MVTTVGAIGSFDGVPEDKEQFGVLDEALSDPKSRLHTARAVGGAFASMEAVRALVSMLSGDPVIGSAQAQAVDLRPGYVQLADASRGTIRDVGGATTRAVERAIDQNTDRTSAAHDAEDRAILADLASKGYSLEEQREILRIMEDSRRFAWELKLGTPMATPPRFVPESDNLGDRLWAVSGSLRSLATLPSKTPQEVTGVETITPDNIRAVIDYVHRPDPTESEAIYKGNKARQEAFVRTLARQGSAWNEKNIPRVPTEDLKRACEMANVLLKNAAHLSRDEARYIVTIALDLFTPESPDLTADQKANRWLNFAQALASIAALTSPNAPWGIRVGETVKLEVDKVTYSFAPEARIRQIPGLPADKRELTSKAYGQLRAAQEAVANQTREYQRHLQELAQARLELEQMKIDGERNNGAMREFNNITGQLLPLLEGYILSGSEAARADFRNKINALVEPLKKAEILLKEMQRPNKKEEEVRGKMLADLPDWYRLIERATWQKISS